MNDTRVPRFGRLRLYDYAVALLGGCATGWFAWWFASGALGGGSGPPLLAYELAAVAGALLLAARLRRDPADVRRSRRVHLLWIPVVLFAFLMISVIIALQNFE